VVTRRELVDPLIYLISQGIFFNTKCEDARLRTECPVELGTNVYRCKWLVSYVTGSSNFITSVVYFYLQICHTALLRRTLLHTVL